MSKNKNNNNKKTQSQVKPETKEVKTVAETVEGKKFPVKEKLGFPTGKRNFYVGSKNILITEGGFISQEEYDLLSADAREIFLA
jgi:hypothetical protein